MDIEDGKIIKVYIFHILISILIFRILINNSKFYEIAAQILLVILSSFSITICENA